MQEISQLFAELIWVVKAENSWCEWRHHGLEVIADDEDILLTQIKEGTAAVFCFDLLATVRKRQPVAQQHDHMQWLCRTSRLTGRLSHQFGELLKDEPGNIFATCKRVDADGLEVRTQDFLAKCGPIH